MYESIIANNYIEFLARAMKEAGCPNNIRTSEDVIKNQYYLSKEDSRGSRYIPLQYKRILEKLILGMFNSTFEYKDKEDVYFEKIGDVLICCANVYLVTYMPSGERKVLGHGFHSLSFDEVMPGQFLSEAERVSKWKSTVIGGAKSRALYDAGIGLEFYGDIFAPEENLDDEELIQASEKKKASQKKDIRYSDDGMPIPSPKKAPKASKADKTVAEVIEPKAENVESNSSKEPFMDLEVAKAMIADVGNYKGMSLGEIYDSQPAFICFLARKSASEEVIKAALAIIESDTELSERFSA